MAKIKTIPVKETEGAFFTLKQEDYISLTDIARYQNPEEPKEIVRNWL